MRINKPQSVGVALDTGLGSDRVTGSGPRPGQHGKMSVNVRKGNAFMGNIKIRWHSYF